MCGLAFDVPDRQLENSTVLAQFAHTPHPLTMQNIPNLTLLGPPLALHKRLAIFSFVVHTPWATEQLLHFSFICALLNDVYGIQVFFVASEGS